MEPLLIVLLALFFIAALFSVYLIRRSAQNSLEKRFDSLRAEMGDALLSNLQLLSGQVAGVTKAVNDQLSSLASQMQNQTGQLTDRVESASSMMGEVKRSIGGLDAATREFKEIGKDIAGLQEILSAHKRRGVLGEFLLGELLRSSLPSKHFELQHTFKNGKRVDAVIKIGGRLVSVDSKFPLENFKRIVAGATDEEKRAAGKSFVSDCRRHIDAIASSYILPGEGTFDFALMYIPAENVYYEIIVTDTSFGGENPIMEYAFSKRVIPVSPNTFYAYLQTILLGLRGFDVTRRGEEILNRIGKLNNDFGLLASDLDVLGRHISNTRSKYADVAAKAERFGLSINGLLSPGEKEGEGPDGREPFSLEKEPDSIKLSGKQESTEEYD
ncbi:MAG: DNA recombination protein RmuC [Thermodesulfobacteriota bacterium]